MNSAQQQIIREAFAMFEHGTMTLLDTVDQVFIAALQCREINFALTETNQLNVTVDGHENFVVRLPCDTLLMLRSILARVGAICGYAEGTLQGDGLLKRTSIEYVSAVIRPKPGSPLYLVDADLTVKTEDGEHMLHVEMSNNKSQPLFWKLSRQP